jgi:hypothetical protein
MTNTRLEVTAETRIALDEIAAAGPYAVVVTGDGCAPHAMEGDFAIASETATILTGDFVTVEFKSKPDWFFIKRVSIAPPPNWRAWLPSPQSEAEPVVGLAHPTDPNLMCFVRTSVLSRLDRVVAWQPAGISDPAA